MRVAPVSFAPRFGAFQVQAVWNQGDKFYADPSEAPFSIDGGPMADGGPKLTLLVTADGDDKTWLKGVNPLGRSADAPEQLAFTVLRGNRVKAHALTGVDGVLTAVLSRSEAGGGFELFAKKLKDAGLKVTGATQQALEMFLEAAIPEYESKSLHMIGPSNPSLESN